MNHFELGATVTYGYIRDYAYNQTEQAGLIRPLLVAAGLGTGFWRWNTTGIVQIKVGEQEQLWATFDSRPFRLDAFYHLVAVQ